MATENKHYKVTILPLSATTSRKFSYESGRNQYTYGSVDLNEFLDKDEASQEYATKLELETNVAEIYDEMAKIVAGDMTWNLV